MTGPSAALAVKIRSRFPEQPAKRLGVAVSGGGDSVALLHLLKQAFANENVTILAVTVDHGLRPESAQEALRVAAWSRELGISHQTLRWTGWDGTGNLQDSARRARYELLADWARDNGISEIALGHTADDQAETVLMRLGRASGVSGLSAMAMRRKTEAVDLIRPMLDIPREDLRAYLRAEGISWIEDPSNQDLRFDRIKARNALATLEPLGITTRSLSEVAKNFSQAREALEWCTQRLAREATELDQGDVLLDLSVFNSLPDELSRRLLIHIVGWIGGADYAPRRAAVNEGLQALRIEKPATLGGCQMAINRQQARVFREYQAVRDLSAPAGQIWDGRWLLQGPETPGGCIRALGPEGVQICQNRKETGRPHASLLSSPSVWVGAELVSAPLAGFENGWTAQLVGGREEFLSSILSH